MARYRSKLEVDAVQFTGENMEEVLELLGEPRKIGGKGIHGAGFHTNHGTWDFRKDKVRFAVPNSPYPNGLLPELMLPGMWVVVLGEEPTDVQVLHTEAFENMYEPL